ncbi:MAG TPA: 4-hydroxy-3-methylbut-2-enyl diphosphate reductase [Chthoniobacterales bacterium]|jgi:4-hydroxy-3-methylbut-2-enyl diphosphate reductase
MKILRAEHYGMCFGVRDAIAQAEQLASTGPLTILGELVHNPLVRERLRAFGAKEGTLEQETSATSANVMITAHGASLVRRKEWAARGYQVADGTCPLVHHLHAQLGALVLAGYMPVIIGQAGHVEVRGLTGDFPHATVIGSEADIANLSDTRRLGVVAQTTQPIERVRALVRQIAQARPQTEVRFVDTVCKPTKDRQLALQRLIAEAELVVVVGGHASNNTRQLVETCRTAGRRALHIERPGELVAEDFDKVGIVGLTAGTSTLQETVDLVHACLLEFAAACEGHSPE